MFFPGHNTATCFIVIFFLCCCSKENVPAAENPPADGAEATEDPEVEEESKTMTLDEYKAQVEKERFKSDVRMRKAGENEDQTRWKNTRVLKKVAAEGDEDDEEYVVGSTWTRCLFQCSAGVCALGGKVTLLFASEFVVLTWLNIFLVNSVRTYALVSGRSVQVFCPNFSLDDRTVNCPSFVFYASQHQKLKSSVGKKTVNNTLSATRL